MGCAQTSTSVMPSNHIPLEQLYDNEGYPLTRVPPVVAITALPTPSYVKSALKTGYPDGRERTERLPFFNRKLPPINKSVSFDEQVLVKARTPTPSKIWYEKSSSTMPMRKHRRHHHDDDDDDDEDEIDEISSDEEEENDEEIDTESQIPKLKPANLLVQRNQANPPFWHKPYTTEFVPPTNTRLENRSFSPTTQQSYINMNTYATNNSILSPVNRIKVRRKLPNLGPPQIAPALLYQPPLQSSIVPPYQSPTQPSTLPGYQIPTQTPIVSPYQSSTQPSTLPSYQFPMQPSSQTFHAQRTLPNPNPVLIEQQPTLINGESSLQNTYYAINRRPIENVT